MIAKHVPMRRLGKSDYSGLVKYLTDDQNKEQRVGRIRITNCEAGSIDDAIFEVLATQKQNKRAKGDKTFHLIVSFRSDERQLDDKTLRAIEEHISSGLGYGEHQRISVVHNDTDNLHIHIAINKIHSTRLTMHEPYYSHRKLAEICKKLEKEYGLKPDNHMPKKSGGEGRATDMEHHTGIESLIGWIKRKCLTEILAVNSWAGLHRVLRLNGLQIRLSGTGCVIVADDGTTVKASTISRGLSKKSLENKFGPFVTSKQDIEPSQGVESPQKGRHEYEKKPFKIRLRPETSGLYAQYQEERKSSDLSKNIIISARESRDEKIKSILRNNRLLRQLIRISGSDRYVKLFLYAQAHRRLIRQLSDVKQWYRGQYEQHKIYRLTWLDWLKNQAVRGNAQALAVLRARGISDGLKGNILEGQESAAHLSQLAIVDNITKKGTVIYRAGRSAIRDDGIRVHVADGASSAVVLAALRLAHEQYGGHLSVNGTAVFKAQAVFAAVQSGLDITFSEPVLESRRQALTTKGAHHERRGTAAGRRGAGGDGRGRLGFGGGYGTRGGRAGFVPVTDYQPPISLAQAESINRVRTLSTLDMVHFARGSEVLLPGHASDCLEYQRTESTNRVRRHASQAEVEKPAAIDAAVKYIKERMEKRAKGVADVPVHSLFTASTDEVRQSLFFAGIRRIDGDVIVLLRRQSDDEIMVMPVDHPTADRLSRLRLGDKLNLTEKGLRKVRR